MQGRYFESEREGNIIKIDNAKAKSELENSRAEIENTREDADGE